MGKGRGWWTHVRTRKRQRDAHEIARHSTFHRRMIPAPSHHCCGFPASLSTADCSPAFCKVCDPGSASTGSSKAKSTEQNSRDNAQPESPSIKDGHQAVSSYTNFSPKLDENVRDAHIQHVAPPQPQPVFPLGGWGHNGVP